MNYDEQNADIKKRISEIELKIKDLQDLYQRAPSVYCYYSDYSAIQRKINSMISLLEGQKEDLIKKLKESPRQRRWSNLKDKGDDFVFKVLNSLPEFPEHVSGRIYRDTNDGCFKWCLIIFVLSAIFSAIVITIKGEWDVFF